MAITISPSFSEASDGSEVLSDFSVDHHEELFHGIAPTAVWQDEATGQYVYDVPFEPEASEEWDYESTSFTGHPVLDPSSSDQAAALYWFDHRTPVTTQELSAMLDGLEGYEGQERYDREQLIAFKCGEIQFQELPFELQQQLVEASGYEAEQPSVTDEADAEMFDAFAALTSATADPEMADVFDAIAEDNYDHDIALLASLSSRFHCGEDPEALIEEAVSILGMEQAMDAYYRFNELLTTYDY